MQGEPGKIPQHEITKSQIRANIFVLKFAHLFRSQLYKTVLLCVVFSWRTPNWRKRKLPKRILQLHSLYRKLILLLK